VRPDSPGGTRLGFEATRANASQPSGNCEALYQAGSRVGTLSTSLLVSLCQEGLGRGLSTGSCPAVAGGISANWRLAGWWWG
jgi:hypothetical protein